MKVVNEIDVKSWKWCVCVWGGERGPRERETERERKRETERDRERQRERKREREREGEDLWFGKNVYFHTSKFPPAQSVCVCVCVCETRVKSTDPVVNNLLHAANTLWEPQASSVETLLAQTGENWITAATQRHGRHSDSAKLSRLPLKAPARLHKSVPLGLSHLHLDAVLNSD